MVWFILRPLGDRGRVIDKVFGLFTVLLIAVPPVFWAYSGLNGLWLVAPVLTVFVVLAIATKRLYFRSYSTGHKTGSRRRERFPDSDGSDMITGERFQALADLSILTPPIGEFHRNLAASDIERLVLPGSMTTITSVTEQDLLTISSAARLFVYSHLLDSFFEEVYTVLDRPFVLMSHNSDVGVGERYRRFLDEGKITHWIAQNVEIRHPRLTCVPIGVANSQWAHGDLEILSRVRNEFISKNQLCFMQFSLDTNYERRLQILDTISSNTDIPEQPARTYDEYLRVLASHRFAICPPGNGIDTHRTWECIYLGVIPIVERSICTDGFSDLPILIVDDWEQVNESLLNSVPPMGDRPLFMARLAYYEGVLRGVAPASWKR